MMRAIVLMCFLGLAAASFNRAAPVPLVAKKVKGHVELSAEQKKTMHFGCVSACKPSPIESKCATACETAMYRCVDETGPSETPEDTKKCQDKVLKLYEETKGIEKKEEKKEEGKKGDKKDAKKDAKKEAKKAKMFLQVGDDDLTEGEADEQEAEEISEEDNAADETGDYTEESDDSEATEGSEDESASDEEETQDDSASEEEETSEEETSEDETSEEEIPEEETSEEEGESFIQVSKGSDDDNTVEGDAAVTAPIPEGTPKEEEAGPDDEAVEPEAAVEEETPEETADAEAGAFVQVSKGSDDTDAAVPVETAPGGHDDGPQSEEADADEAAPVEEAKVEEETPEETADAESFAQVGSSWKPEPCGELAPGVPCTKLYEHPQGSQFVTACPVAEQTNPEACGAFFEGKAAADQCSQITCPKALGVTMKLVCGGGCCPSCWAPDHVINLDRHTTVDDAAVVDSAPQAPSTCGGVKCFKLACAAGFTEGFVNGDCCNSCVQGR